MTTRPIFDYMPDFYQRFFPSEFDTRIPDETATTCAECAMWGDHNGSSPQRMAFSKNSKCCTHYPNLPNYIVGAILEDGGPDLETSVSRLRGELDRRVGTLPLGLFRSRKFDLLIHHSPDSFGRSETLICPFFERDAGICTLWPYRNSVCGTWFCKYIGGQDGRLFWQSLRRFLEYAEKCLSRYVLMKAGWPTDSILFSLPSNTKLSLEDIDEKPLQPSSHNKLWHDYSGREEEWYRESYRIMKTISRDEFMRIVGVNGQVYLDDVLSKHRKLSPDAVPPVLKRNPALKVIDIDSDFRTVVGYSPLDPVRLTDRVYELLDAFKGRESTDEVIEQRLGQSKPVPADDVLVSLYRYRLLVDAAAETEVTDGTDKD